MNKKPLLILILATVVVLLAGAFTYWQMQREAAANGVAVPSDATDLGAASNDSATGTAGGGDSAEAKARGEANGEDHANDSEFADECSFHPPKGPSLDGSNIKNYKYDHVPSDWSESGSLADGTVFKIRASGCEDFVTEEVSFEFPGEKALGANQWYERWKEKAAELPVTGGPLATRALSLLDGRMTHGSDVARTATPQEFMVCMNGNLPGGTDCKDAEDKSIACPVDCGWDEGGAATLKIEKIENGVMRVTVSESTSA